MKFADLLDSVGALPVFRTGLLLAGDRDPADVRRQLTRWTAAGKIFQLRRNVYALAAPWRRVDPHPFLIANVLHQPSYVSLQSALGHHDLIPEAVPVTMSVTTGRPIALDTPLGRYVYRHVHPGAFFGYARAAVASDQEAFVADPAKALLDLVYLTPGGESPEHLASLRLEDLDAIPAEDLLDHARRWGKGKVGRAVEHVLRMRNATSAGPTAS